MPHARRWLAHVVVVFAAIVVASVPLARRGLAVETTGSVDGAPLVITAVQGVVVPVSAESAPAAHVALQRLAWPVSGVFTQGFGPSPYWFEPSIRVGDTLYSHFHTGIDIAVPWGTAVHAARAGRVEYAGWQGGYGYTVVLLHDGGLRTLYAHLSRALVSRGQEVGEGAVIASAGATGNATGPHLHFEVRPQPQSVSDPMAYLDPAQAADPKPVPVQWGATPGR